MARAVSSVLPASAPSGKSPRRPRRSCNTAATVEPTPDAAALTRQAAGDDRLEKDQRRDVEIAGHLNDDTFAVQSAPMDPVQLGELPQHVRANYKLPTAGTGSRQVD